MERIEIRPERDQWRWAYRNGNGVELMSNQLYERRDEAEDAAHTAYPDIRLESNEASAEASDRRILIAIVVLLLAVIGLGILLRKTEREELE